MSSSSSHHRRLWLYANGQGNGNDTSVGNNTIECIQNCIGFCNLGVCLPSPPSSSPHDGNSGNATTPINLHNHDRVLPTIIITATCSIVVLVLILMALYIYLRFRRHARRNRPQAPAAADVDVDDDDDALPGDEVEHHIWYIRTQGVDENTIASIAALIYKSGDGVVEGRDCSVCLGEFQDGELVRLLPKCSHAFHLPCIDRWLRSHVNCPLCRAPIMSQPLPSPRAPSLPPPVAATDSPDTETPSLDRIENPPIEAMTRPSNNDGVEFRVGIHPAEEPSSQHPSSDLQPIRRSISMDSLPMDVLIRDERREGNLAEGEEGRSPPNTKKPGRFLNRSSWLKGPTRMDRSLSSRSLRWASSRKSALPL